MIRAKFWGEAADKWDSVIRQGKVYLMSRGRVQVANKRFNTLSHPYEISFFTDAEIIAVADDGIISSTRNLNALMSLRDIAETKRELPFVADVLAVITDIQPTATVISKKTGDEFKKRSARLVDRSQYAMEISLWGPQADALESVAAPTAIVLSGMQIREWQGGRVGSTGKSSELLLDLKAHPEACTKAAQLLRWYEEHGSVVRFTNLSKGTTQFSGNSADGEQRRRVEEKTLDEIRDQSEGIYRFIGQIRRVYWRARPQQRASSGGEGPHFSSPPSHSSSQDNSVSGSQETEAALMYPACSRCRKKLVDSGEGDYACYTCDDQHTQADWRYMLMVNFVDATGHMSVRCFAEQGEQLLGVPAAELRRWSFEERARLLDLTLPINEHFRVVVRVSMQSYQGEERVSRSAVKLERLSVLEAARQLAHLIKGLLSAAAVSDEEVTRKQRQQLANQDSSEEEAGERKNGDANGLKDFTRIVKQEGLVF